MAASPRFGNAAVLSPRLAFRRVLFYRRRLLGRPAGGARF
jgi:hypothetical protein